MEQAMRTLQSSAPAGREVAAAAAVATIVFVGMAIVFFPTLKQLVNVWDTQPEYSYGYLIPFVCAFLVYQRLNELAAVALEDSWVGTAMVAGGLLAAGLGRISTLDTLAQYGFLLVVWGALLSYLGRRAFVTVMVPMSILAAMVPVPNYLLRELSQGLQLLSSQLGVEFIRWFGVSVYLEGNVIDLGSMKLQVVEACSGLRYLFSLLTLSFLVAYFYRAALWQRSMVFLSAVPVTVLMNSVRIALVGVTVDRWGPAMAEGILHDFEGITIFLGCVAILLAEIRLMSWLTADRRGLKDLLALDLPPIDRARVRRLVRVPGRATLAALGLVAVAALLSMAAPERSHAKVQRPAFSGFPMQLAEWRGTPSQLPLDVLAALKLDDYLLADYADGRQPPVNLYASYYSQQAEGNSAHSPRACLPGDGWEIRGFGERTLSAVQIGAQPLLVNRVIIQKADDRALVYYWFQQRGRFIRGEYAVKLYLFADSFLRSRTDGAMVRLVTPLDREEDLARADARLAAFAAVATPQLRRFIPE